jgi:hypothetical protein
MLYTNRVYNVMYKMMSHSAFDLVVQYFVSCLPIDWVQDTVECFCGSGQDKNLQHVRF